MSSLAPHAHLAARSPVGIPRGLSYGQSVPRIRRPLLALIILVALLAIGYLIAALR